MHSLFHAGRWRKISLSLLSLGVLTVGAGGFAEAQDTPVAGGTVDGQNISAAVLDQIASLEADKESRTPAQQKMDSQLIYGARMAQGQAITNLVPTLDVSLTYASNGQVLIDIDGAITDNLLKQIGRLGGTVISAFPEYNTVRASLPLGQVERLASNNNVQSIRPADQYRLVGTLKTRRDMPAGAIHPGPLMPLAQRKSRLSAELPAMIAQARATQAQRQSEAVLTSSTLPLSAFSSLASMVQSQNVLLRAFTLNADSGSNASPTLAPGSGSVDSEGDTTHRANLARATFGPTGAGLKIGVLSDSIDNTSGSYAAAVASGDVSPVTVIPGQAGTGAGEGLAMLEIVHDLAPGAQLYFATANSTQAQFATNIQALRTAGCDIIIDDVVYFAEGVFQDGTVAQAVNTVTASGALYFSSAGNEYYLGSLGIPGVSGVWEGDFFDSGTTGLAKTGGTFHNFAGVTGLTGTQDPVYVFGANAAYLFWSDPLGASGNDYDLFLTNTTGTTVSSSGANTQNGTGNPYESVNITATGTGRRLIIFKKTAAAARFLHLTLNGNVFYSNATPVVPYYATNGQTAGHSAAADAFSVAAAPAVSPGPYPGVFSTTSPPENFTSDGPRRIFFNADGTAITPGNFLSTGGTVRAKPDVTGADGVKTTLPSSSGLNPFYGTSAAAPHAGAVAALLKSYNPALTNAQIRSILTGTAVDINTAGYDNVTGFGIVDAYSAIAAAPTPMLVSITFNPATVAGGVGSTGTITLRDPAPAGGAVIPLSVTGPASVPASVTVPAGQTTASFPITTSVVSVTTLAQIQAVYLTETKTGFLTVAALYTASGKVTTTTGDGVPGVTINSLVPGVGMTTPAMTNSTPVAIPDAVNATGNSPGAAVTSAVTFTGPGTVGSISVGVNITHTYQTDLAISLVAPDGTTVVLRPQAASGGGTSLVTTFPSPTPSANPLSVLFGKPIAGTWLLKVQDYYTPDSGTLNSFTLTLGTNIQNLVTATTDINGNYAFPDFTFIPGTFTLTPTKPGFGFSPASANITVGPNATQNFTLSQPGIRTSATAVKTGTEYLVTVTVANGGPDAANAQITRALIGTTNPTSPGLPASLGTITLGNSASVTLHYPLSIGSSGTTAALRLSGTVTGSSFGGTIPVALP